MEAGTHRTHRLVADEIFSKWYLNRLFIKFKSPDGMEDYATLKYFLENPKEDFPHSKLWLMIFYLEIDCNVDGTRRPASDPHVHAGLKSLASSDGDKYMRLRICLSHILSVFDPKSESLDMDAWKQRVDEFCANFVLKTNGIELGTSFEEEYEAAFQTLCKDSDENDERELGKSPDGMTI